MAVAWVIAAKREKVFSGKNVIFFKFLVKEIT